MTSRAQLPRGTDAAAFRRIRSHGHRSNQIKFFTIVETAELLGVSTRTVRRLIKAGDLITHRFGGVIRIAESDLRAFLALHRDA
jgi:excisionase family DNA binding protein